MGLAGSGLVWDSPSCSRPARSAAPPGWESTKPLLRLFGLREIASGVAILAAKDPQRWLWARVAGDGLDGALLASGMARDNPARHRTLVATLAVAPVVALDLIYALKSSGERPHESRSYVRFREDVEQPAPDEAETIDKILQSTHRLMARTQAKEGHAIRVSHAKSHGVAVGELTIVNGLPDQLRQGLFARGGRYPVIVRLSNVPGEIDDDAVGTQRGLAFKVLGIEGEMISGHEGEATQDFVLDSGNTFAAPDAKGFLMNHLLLEHAPQMPDNVKAGVADVSRATNKALNAVGLNSVMLDFFGHSRIHPMAEAYFTQAPIRYGDFIAKLAVVPVARAQTALAKTDIDRNDPDALRTATVGYLRDHDAAFEVRVQLCTDLKSMPVEDASKEWSEDESPYVAVAQLRVPRQEAYSPARQAYVDDALSFCVSHSLAAHRPLGSIMRARLRAYPEMSRARREANSKLLTEPRSIDEVPA